MSKLRLYLNATGNDADAYKRAVAAALIIAKDNSDIKKIVLLTPKKEIYDLLVGVFTPNQIKSATKGGFKFNPSEPLIKTEALTTYRGGNNLSSEVVITCGLDSDEIFLVEGYSSVVAIVAVSWVPHQLEKWVKTWDPRELRNNPLPVTPYPQPSCITKYALSDLNEFVAKDKSLRSHSNESVTVTYLMTLHKYDSPIDSDTAGAYLTSQFAWKTDRVKEAQEIINQLNAGGSPKGGKPEQMQKHYERWKKECEAETATII
ncbi:hypothetical protein SAMN02745146_2286 [Hymenobacter daecheongensis DSM 21074]|uniref:Uncharacterized protein n=1 Tax=Hymenobacter daecheongensis DSM 21074 TaxID=1121955 RepID=A0A1M6GJL4_9BACT|nr:hypothetical protein [Hymenobacter daecheongensis]SHJ10118.1 hypothetical protein SAMN02745146_2286 [Hymenobacter daecheongensis DSM 21074]